MKTGWNMSPVSMTELGIYLDWRKNLKGTAYNIPIISPLPEGVLSETPMPYKQRALSCILFILPPLDFARSFALI